MGDGNRANMGDGNRANKGDGNGVCPVPNYPSPP